MSTCETVTLGVLRHQFEAAGFDTHAFVTVLTGLITIWRSNDLLEDITKEVIFNELDLEELQAQVLWNATQQHLMTIAIRIRNLALAGRLIRWSVYPHSILLEVEHAERQDSDPQCLPPAVD